MTLLKDKLRPGQSTNRVPAACLVSRKINWQDIISSWSDSLLPMILPWRSHTFMKISELLDLLFSIWTIYGSSITFCTHLAAHQPYQTCIPRYQARGETTRIRLLVSLVSFCCSFLTDCPSCIAQNFGFDIRGDIKVFDFGLTKALTPSRRAKKSKMYNLTPITGSFPYSKCWR